MKNESLIFYSMNVMTSPHIIFEITKIQRIRFIWSYDVLSSKFDVGISTQFRHQGDIHI